MTDQHALQLQAGNCPKCGKPKSVRQSHTALNPGRWFATCPNKCYSSFQWLSSAPLSRSTEDSKLNPINERMSQGRSSVERGRGAAKDGSDSPLELASEVVSPIPLIAGRLAFLSSQPATVSLVSDKDDATVPASSDRPFVPSKYQSAIYDFLKSGNGNGVVIATAGCLSGDTILEVNRGGKSYKTTIAHLHHMLEGGTSYNRKFDLSIKTRIRSVKDENIIGLGNIAKSFYSGEKMTYTVATEDGRSIRATADHLFWTGKQEFGDIAGWCRLSRLSVGDFLFCDSGKRERSKAPRQETRKDYPSAFGMHRHPFSTNRGGGNKTVPLHRIVYEAHLNGMEVTEFVEYIRGRDLDSINFVNPATHMVHHKDENPNNNQLDNLQLMTRQEHYLYHAHKDGWKHVQARIEPTRIISIREYAVEATYDIQMVDDDNPNFLANGIVVHNSGKTSTIRNATPYLPRGAKVAAIAFNRRNSLDLQKVMPEWVRASTFHSLGLSNLKRANSKLKVDDDKVWNLLHRVEDRGGPLADVIAEDGPAIRQVVNLVKSTLSPTDNDSLSSMVEHYGIPLNGNAEPAFDIVRQVMTSSDADDNTVDFGDMLYRCANGSVGCEKFDFILQDEAQDATQAQIEFVKRSLKPTGRLLAVGDPRQAIYSWAGSAIDSIDQLTKYHHASTLPLSITYRLPLSHVENVNRRFPDVGMEARDNAPDGIIGDRSYPEMISKLADGDMVIARVNSVLVPAAFELIREGRKAVILGRDIGKNLGVLITKIQKRNPGANLNQVIGALRTYADREISKLIHARKASQAANLSDSVETIIALSDSCYTVSDIQRKISAVFSDDLKGTIFSSIHRAKGAEADNVYFLDPSKCPHPMAKEEWQKAGEMNCLFVALTRSKHGLYMVESD